MSARPFNEKDLITQTNGDPLFLGALVSTGAAVNNATTATPFATTPLGPPATSKPQNLNNTLAGKTLLLQTTAAGLIKTSSDSNMVVGGPNSIVAQQTVLPPIAGTAPGVALTAGERVVVIMHAQHGWLQWLPVSGSANLLVYELR